MYKQTLCVTLPISAAVIIAAALFANAGDLDPDPGPILPTMHTLTEIYGLVQQSSPCGGCAWEYKRAGAVSDEVLAIPGSGFLYGFWIKNTPGVNFSAVVSISDGPIAGGGPGTVIGEFGSTQANSGFFSNKFFELNVVFEQGLYLRSVVNNPEMTLLYRSANP